MKKYLKNTLHVDSCRQGGWENYYICETELNGRVVGIQFQTDAYRNSSSEFLDNIIPPIKNTSHI